MDLLLKNTVAFIAGSSRGIGLAIAQAFLLEGGNVVLTGRNTGPLEEAAAACRTMHGTERVLTICGDMQDRSMIAGALKQTIAQFGQVDHVVANVGSGKISGGLLYEDAAWQKAIDCNLLASVRLVEEALPAMMKTGKGTILFLSSIAGVETIAAPLSYCAAKAAVIAYAKKLAQDVAHDGIRVNVLAPGNILFAGGSWEERLESRRQETEEYIQNEVPLRRFGTPEEIANMAVFLASSKSSFTTGSCIVIDGGQTRSL